jgi:ribose/xylose/arabinose/galactoside ABC-type transport system permease subunit
MKRKFIKGGSVLDGIHWILIGSLLGCFLFIFLIYITLRARIDKKTMKKVLISLIIVLAVVAYYFWRWLEFTINNHIYPGK